MAQTKKIQVGRPGSGNGNTTPATVTQNVPPAKLPQTGKG